MVFEYVELAYNLEYLQETEAKPELFAIKPAS